jgi:SAM-dependent methyltransferase
MEYWNHNVHYQWAILDAVPPGCGEALDVGCGDGLLVRQLAARCRSATGIDSDPRIIELARQRARSGTGPAHDVGASGAGLATGAGPTVGAGPDAGAGPSVGAGPANGGAPDITFIDGDFMKYPFESGAYDFVSANTSLHHMDFAQALLKMADLLAPGGTLAVVGLANDGWPLDKIIGAAGLPPHLFYKWRYGKGGPGCVIKDPDMTWAQVRETAARLLPGSRYRRHLMWRYSITWRKTHTARTPVKRP